MLVSNLVGKTGVQNDEMTNEASKDQDLVSKKAGVHSLNGKGLDDQTLCRLSNPNGTPRKRCKVEIAERN